MTPTLANYIDSINNPDVHFKSLRKIHAIRRENGEPQFTVSSNIVRFNVEWNGRRSQLCCFLANHNSAKSRYKALAQQMESLGSRYLTPWSYMEKELAVCNERGVCTMCDIILQHEPRGEMLDAFIGRCCLQLEHKSMHKLMREGCNMAVEFYEKGFVHGAMTPSNIIVTPNIVPVLSNYRSSHVISPDQPQPTNVSIDNDNINFAVLAVIVWLVSYKPQLYKDLRFVMTFKRPSLRQTLPYLLEYAQDLGIVPLENIAQALINANDKLRDRAQLNQYLLELADCDLAEYTDLNKTWTSTKYASNYKPGSLKMGALHKGIDSQDYNYIGNISDTLIRVRDHHNRWLFLNKHGSKAFGGATFQHIEDFVEGRAVVMIGDNYGLIDRDNKFVIEPECEDMVWYGDAGIAVTAMDGHYSIRDRNGQTITDREYDWIGMLGDDLLPASIDDKHGFLDSKGRVTIDFIFDDALSFTDGAAPVVKDGRDFEIDIKGDEIPNHAAESAATQK